MIGVLLIVIAFFIAVEVKDLLIGQSVDPKTLADMKAFLGDRSEIQEVFNLLTMQFGPDHYNDSARVLRGLIVIERDEHGHIVSRIDAEQAIWKENLWELQIVRVFSWDQDERNLVENDSATF